MKLETFLNFLQMSWIFWLLELFWIFTNFWKVFPTSSELVELPACSLPKIIMEYETHDYEKFDAWIKLWTNTKDDIKLNAYEVKIYKIQERRLSGGQPEKGYQTPIQGDVNEDKPFTYTKLWRSFIS